MIRKLLPIMVLLLLAVICMPGMAQSISFAPIRFFEPGPVNGCWMLEGVYENASGEERYRIDPEEAQSLYAESKNEYYFSPDGTGWMSMDSPDGVMVVYGTWRADGDKYVQTCDNTQGYADYTKTYVPDLDPGYINEFVWDEADQQLHRYWKIDDPDSSYHDLDFVYEKVLFGTYQMKEVYSLESGVPMLLEPEESASLYAESENVYVFAGQNSTVIVPEIEETAAEPVGEAGTAEEGNSEEGTPEEGSETGLQTPVLERDGNNYILYPDGEHLEFVYDPEADVLHRYWKDDAPDATYKDLDFVYRKAPVRDAWKMKAILRTDTEGAPVLLDPDLEEARYHENYYDYYFSPDGTARAEIPSIVEDDGTWSQDGNEVLLSFDDGTSMLFEWDSRNEILHRYWSTEDENSPYHSLDYVFLYR